MEESSLSEIEIEINSDLKSYKDNEEYIILREVIVSKKMPIPPYFIKPIFFEQKIIGEDEINRYTQDTYVYKKQEYLEYIKNIASEHSTN